MDSALSYIERPVDRVLVSINETMRSFTHEAWQYASQVANGSSVFVLGYMSAVYSGLASNTFVDYYIDLLWIII